MNTQATQHPTSSIEVLAEAMGYAHDDNEQDILDAINSIWLPIFKSEQNFAMALDALKISLDNINARVMCHHYLDAMRGVK
jgi:hypothetical protein